MIASEEVFDGLISPTFVMGDFKPDNILVQHKTNGWQLSGIIDYTTGNFSDEIADLPKMVAMYHDNGEEELAKQFTVYYKSLRSKRHFH
ncbi:phosphotransferase [Paenibacillus tarimensis]